MCFDRFLCVQDVCFFGEESGKESMPHLHTAGTDVPHVLRKQLAHPTKTVCTSYQNSVHILPKSMGQPNIKLVAGTSYQNGLHILQKERDSHVFVLS